MTTRVVILTGTNRGLGKRTAEILLEKYSAGTHFIFTQRQNDTEELTAAFKMINPTASFEIQPLDISDKISRANFLTWFAVTHKTADVIFNNAGVYDPEDKGTRPSRKTAQFTLDVNFISTVEFTEEILPYLTEDAKIIEVSSTFGQLTYQPEAARAILSDQTLTKEKLFTLAQDYMNNAEDESKELLFSNFVYHFSKAILTSYVRIVAQKSIKPTQSIFAVHPGWVQTDMGGQSAPATVDQACPYLADIVGKFPYGRHPLNGKLIFENKEMEY